jgi:hypothetical protein
VKVPTHKDNFAIIQNSRGDIGEVAERVDVAGPRIMRSQEGFRVSDSRKCPQS